MPVQIAKDEIPEELIEKFVEIGYEPRRQLRTVLDARRRAPAQIRFILAAVHDGRLDKELGVVGPRIEGHIVQFPADDKPWAPSTHFRATGSHSSLALADGLIGNDGEEAEAVIFAVSGTGTEEEA